jgi:hypothetical protein
MQTFLPYPSFKDSAAVLDRQRLGKQRVEVLQLLNVLTGVRQGWGNHPAAKMWRGYESALAVYGCVMCREWTGRGYNDTCYGKILERVPAAFNEVLVLPPWVGSSDFHLSHRSNLLRKLPEHYRPLFGDISDDLEYVWPSN